MNKQESMKLWVVLTTNYKKYYENYSNIEIDTLVDLWANIFIDKSYNEVSRALYSFMATDTKGFPPVPGQLMELIDKVKETASGNDTYMSEVQAWGLVTRAVSNSIYNSDKEFEKLPDMIKKTIHSPAYLRELAMQEFNSSVESSNFKRAYRSVIEREKLKNSIPKSVIVAQIKELSQNNNNLDDNTRIAGGQAK